MLNYEETLDFCKAQLQQVNKLMSFGYNKLLVV